MTESKPQADRPLSPHLMIYKLPITALMSISHRITGWALTMGTLALVWFLVAAATGPGAYDFFMSHATAWYGKLMLFGWSFALFYHMCNGIRHMLWDLGYLLKLKTAKRSSYLVILAAILMTACVWHCALNDTTPEGPEVVTKEMGCRSVCAANSMGAVGGVGCIDACMVKGPCSVPGADCW